MPLTFRGGERAVVAGFEPTDRPPRALTAAQAAAGQLADLPPACKLIFVVLYHEGPLTAEQVSERTYLNNLSTTRRAIRRLRDQTSLLQVTSDPECSQRHLYGIDETAFDMHPSA